jgi:ABC-type multidrug transport system ATPase subunit
VTPAMTPVVQTRGLTKRYRRVTALSDCSVTVPEGRISALLGPNGAGKTTLLRLLTGLARPTAGEMAVLGGAPRQHPAFLADIGFLAQEIPVYRRPDRRAVLAPARRPGTGRRPPHLAGHVPGPAVSSTPVIST